MNLSCTGEDSRSIWQNIRMQIMNNIIDDDLEDVVIRGSSNLGVYSTKMPMLICRAYHQTIGIGSYQKPERLVTLIPPMGDVVKLNEQQLHILNFEAEILNSAHKLGDVFPA
ncbi:hypothetical protein VNO77_25393 [Canavalia gladiata]|uniref:Uncharacterized protein n=1 Tax=Canavalia gladiata TaxID=3824 RepID=A0AAN9QAV6_CANGL